MFQNWMFWKRNQCESPINETRNIMSNANDEIDRKKCNFVNARIDQS